MARPDGAELPFTLRGIDGRVEITYVVNDDPKRWGFDLLGLDFDIEAARGFPVMTARSRYAAEGYAGYLGWIQVVDYVVRHGDVEDAAVFVVPDVAPQARDANTPYCTFGYEPVMFDAPAYADEPNVDWNARTFLAYSPDCLMTPIVEPLCGFFWGYRIVAGVVTPKELRTCTSDDWLGTRRLLRLRLPTWDFRGDDWCSPAFTD